MLRTIARSPSDSWTAQRRMRRTSPTRIPSRPEARAPPPVEQRRTFPSALAAKTTSAPLDLSNVALLAMTVRAGLLDAHVAGDHGPREAAADLGVPPMASPIPPIPTEIRSARAMAIPPWTTEMSCASAR